MPFGWQSNAGLKGASSNSDTTLCWMHVPRMMTALNRRPRSGPVAGRGAMTGPRLTLTADEQASLDKIAHKAPRACHRH
jgi:hypothetical protein